MTAGVGVEFYPYKLTTPGHKRVLGTVRNALPWRADKTTLPNGKTFVHVVPNDDDHFPHYLDDYCLCAPRVEKLYDGTEFLGLVWSHNAWDGREEFEKMRAQPLL